VPPGGPRAAPGLASLNRTRLAADVPSESARDKPRDGEDYEFIPPDFDEDAFIHREIVSFRTTSILFVWGIVAAAVSWAAFAGLHGASVAWLLGLAICAVFGYSLRWLFPRLGADIAHFGTRDWLGTAFLFFFTWLAFFILAINPPVSDFAPPRVELHASPALQQAGGTVAVDLFVEDNTKVTDHAFAVTRGGAAVPFTLSNPEPGHYRALLANASAGAYEATATAHDPRGHAGNATIAFTVAPQLLTVDLPEGGTFDSPTDQVLVKASDPALKPCTFNKGAYNAPCVRAAELRFSDGRALDAEYSSVFGGWQATPAFAGWSPGPNNFTVALQMLATYAGNTRVDGGNITAGPFTVTMAQPIGTHVAALVPEPTAHQRRVPGLETPLVAAAVVGLAMVLRRRR